MIKEKVVYIGEIKEKEKSGGFLKEESRRFPGVETKVGVYRHLSIELGWLSARGSRIRERA